MSMRHTEVFIEGSHVIGYHCFTCQHEETGYQSLASAESAADMHVCQSR